MKVLQINAKIPEGNYCWSHDEDRCQFLHEQNPGGHARCGLRTVFDDISATVGDWDGEGIPKLKACKDQTR